MKRRLLFLFLMLITAKSGFSQINFDATFENGDSLNVDYWDDPFNLPPFELRAYSASTFVGGGNIGGVEIQPVIRLNSKLSFDASLFVSLISDQEYKDVYPRALEFGISGHYELFEPKITSETKSIGLYSRRSGPDEIEVYKMDLPVKSARTFYADGGLNYIQAPQFVGLNVDTINYEYSRFSSFGLNIGLSTQKTILHATRVNNKGKASWRNMYKTNRWYVNLSLGIPNYSIFESVNGEFIDRSELFTEGSANPIGVRLGYDWTRGFAGGKVAFLFGFDLGLLPYFKPEELALEGLERFLLNSYGQIRLGLSFGKIHWPGV